MQVNYFLTHYSKFYLVPEINLEKKFVLNKILIRLLVFFMIALILRQSCDRNIYTVESV